MSHLSVSLVTFKKKIEEAVILVPAMAAEEKLKAVQFWNVISERLQEIVNNSAADINALAMRLEQEEQHQQPLPHTQSHSERHSGQPSVAMMNSMPTISTDHSSDDKQELYLPIISHQNIINDNSIISNNSSNHMTTHEFSQNGVNTSGDADDEEIAEHLASVITSYHETHPNNIQESSQQLFISFGERHPKESQEIYQHMNRNPIEMSTTSATTSVIQELDQNMLTSQRRNVIQSTQRAIEAIEKNLQNCCNDFENNFENKNQINFNNNNNLSDNNCDENINYNSIIDNNNSNTNHNIIKIIENPEESLGESSANNHIFNETSFDVSSYASSEDTEQQKHFRIDENLNDSNNSEEEEEEEVEEVPQNLRKTNGVKNKSKTNGTTNKSTKNLVNKNQTTNKSVFECDICHKVLPNNSALVSHQWIHSKPYSCEYDECKARFSTKGNLLVHQRRHTGEKPFACSQEGCTASFSTKGNLKRHVKAHSGERPWKCAQCDSRFTEKKSLKVHMRRHTGEKPYVCQVCGKSFSQTGVLQTHMALHLDERKHLCELCGKAFRQRSQLRLHVLRHEGVKRWDCSDCDAKFLTKGDLERHHRVHTGERPFVCDLCGKTFTRQQSLNEHSNRHYGLKPYSCTVCSKTFAEMSACYKHIKVHKKQQTVDKNSEINDKTPNKLTNNTIITTNRKITTNGIKSAEDLRNTRSQINVIQSTTSSGVSDKGLIYVNRSEQINSNTNPSIDDSVISSNSNNNSNDNQSLEYVDFAAINLLANTSSQQKII